MTEEDPEVVPKLDIIMHSTFVKASEEFVLMRCEDEGCMCGKVHCPFCNTDHYKPTQPARVRDHLNLMHFMHAVHYDGMMIVKCFRECTEGIPAGHYHCPLCLKQTSKRAAFTRHLQSHLEKVGKDVTAVQAPDFKQPGKIVFDGHEIPLCTKVCPDALGKHYHCPLCTTKNSTELGPMMAHLWRCREEERQVSISPASKPKSKRVPKKVQPERETPPAKKLHLSIVKSMADLPVQRCNSDTCCDKRYHCPLCSKTKYRPGLARELRDHFQVHWKGRVEYKDFIIVSCNNNCRDRRSNRAFTHYHCPECSELFHGKEVFESHLETCSDIQAMAAPTPSPRGRGRPRKSERRVVETTAGNDTEPQVMLPEEEEPALPAYEPPPVPKAARGRMTISSREKAMLALAESSDDDMGAFDKVTAIISKKIITSLAASTSVEDVLDDVAKNTGINWSWSPGTVEPVYVMSGDLISLVKAKRLLKELKEDYETRRLRELEEAESEVEDYEPPLHFASCDTPSEAADESAVIPEKIILPPPQTATTVLAQQGQPLQMVVDSVSGVAQIQAPVAAAVHQPTMEDIGSGELHISAEEHTTPNTYDTIQGEPMLTEDILQRSVIIAADNNIITLPQVSVESIPQTSVSDLQMGQNFADSLMEAATAELVVEGTTQHPSVQLSENIFQPDFESNETSVIEIPNTVESSEIDSKVLTDEISGELTSLKEDAKESAEGETDHSTIEIPADIPSSETAAGVELQEKIFDDQGSKDDVKESQDDKEDSVHGDDIEIADLPPIENTPSLKKEVIDLTNSKSEEKEKVTPSPRRKKSIPITPERKYSTRGVKVNFTELHTGRKQTVVESSDDDTDDGPSPSPKPRSRGRPPGSSGFGRGRPPGRGKKRGRGRPPKRGRGRPPKRPRLEEIEREEEEEEEEEEVVEEQFDEEDMDDDDPDYVMVERNKSNGGEDDTDPGEESPKKKFKTPPAPVESHIAAMPVVRFAGQTRGQKENKPEESPLDMLLNSIKTEVIDPDYMIPVRTRGRGRARGRGRGRRKADSFDSMFLEEAFKPQPCLDCPFLAESFSQLTDHMIDVHNITDHLRCDICEKAFTRQKHMTHHLIMKHGPLALADGQVYQHDGEEMGNKCSICGWESQQFAELTDHYINHHQAYDVLRCDVCEIVFKKARHRTTHLDNVHGPRNRKGTFVCDLCGHTCDKQRSLNWHKSYAHNMSTKKNPDILYCRKCDFETNEQSEMRLHKRTHLEERKWCDLCKKSFSATTDMKTHMQAVHLKTKSCTCSVCGKTFSHWRYLTAHMERHTGERKHLCNVCGQRFSKAAILKEHIETHKVMSERNYKHICPYCDSRYYSKDKYMDHLNKHTGEKPHRCEECNKGFSFRSMLLKHRIYVHTTDRPFKCDCCDKAFKFKQILKNHMVLHTGESKYICDGCKKPFSCSATLKTHRPKCRGDQSWQKRKSGVAKAVAASGPPTMMVPKQEYQELTQLQLDPQQIQQVQVDSAALQQVHVAVSQPNLTQLVDTIVVEMGDGQRSIVDLNSLEAATQMTETDNVATGIYLCSVCNAMFDTVNAAEEHIAQAHAPGKQDVEDAQEKLELEEVMEAEADANITNLISELETKVKAKLDHTLLEGLKPTQ